MEDEATEPCNECDTNTDAVHKSFEKDISECELNSEFRLDELQEEALPEEEQSCDLSEDLSTEVLDPNNPLLEKFQKTLKDHLLRQIAHLKNEINEHESDIKTYEQKKEEIGKKLYEEQQVVAKQQTTLQNLITQLTTTKAASEELDNVLKEKKQLFKEKREIMLKAKNKEEEQRKELEHLDYLIMQINEWEKHLENDLAIKQTIAEKCRKSKKEMMEDKKLQDMLIYKLMTRIWELEKELDEIEVQLRVQDGEREEMADAVCKANATLEGLQTEYRVLRFSWNSVVVSIGMRDKKLNCIQAELVKFDEKFKVISRENEKLKKETQKEMEQNETLTMFKESVLKDMRNSEIARDEELKHKLLIEKELEQMAATIAQIEADIEDVHLNKKKINIVLENISKELEQLLSRKRVIEEDIFKKLEEQAFNDRIALNINQKLRELRGRNTQMEEALSIMENKTSKALSEVEAQKFANEELKKLNSEVEQQYNDLMMESNHLQGTIKKCLSLFTRRQKDLDISTTKLQKALEETGGQLITPLQLRLIELEKTIASNEEEIENLQRVWLQDQGHLVDLTEQRQEQAQKAHVLKKQITLIEQKNLRITKELADYKKKQEAVKRNIIALYNRLKILCDQLFQKRENKEDLNLTNDFARYDYIMKLQDAEMECLKINEEIAQIEEEKKMLAQDIININRDILEWEKRYKIAKECKEKINQDKSSSGEIGSMKIEVHRMEVRYSQLMKAQEQLIKDLELCVTRRDTILDLAQAREKRSKHGIEKTRCNVQKRIEDMKNKIVQIQNEMEDMKKETENLKNEQNFVCHETEKLEFESEAIAKRIIEISEEIEKLVTKRQMDFQLLVKLQKKLTMYTELSKGKAPYTVYRTEDSLTTEYMRQKEMNKNLSDLIDTLTTAFPEHKHQFERILNTLKVSALLNF